MPQGHLLTGPFKKTIINIFLFYVTYNLLQIQSNKIKITLFIQGDATCDSHGSWVGSYILDGSYGTRIVKVSQITC